ncbi:hypothetical protein, partial [Neptunomonas phycophila]|uniref:hypothetical protein n=1 Tax=Neptunomonas phycophila TaxID=1572645 RepID=UPI000A474251
LSDSEDTSYSDRKRALFRNQFLDYAKATQGVNVIRWSTGLRDLFGLGSELTDAEILKKQEDNSDLVSRINPEQWKQILKRKHRSYVLELSELDD